LEAAGTAHAPRTRTGWPLLALLAALLTALAAPAAAPAAQWFKTDFHRHSVLSADARADLGVVATNMKSLGYNAVFVTDHDRGSQFQISGLTADSVTLNEPKAITQADPKGLGHWVSRTSTRLTASTNDWATTPTRSGKSYHLAATGTGGETFLYNSRGPNLRSGDILLDFWVYPVRLDPGSGVAVSASIGGDPTVDSSLFGYTAQSATVNTGSSAVLVWQLGKTRQATTTGATKVFTNDLPSTLGVWNHYALNLTTGSGTWNVDGGAPTSVTGVGLRDMFADQPVPQAALAHVKLAAQGNTLAGGGGGTADAYFDDYNLRADQPRCPAEEFVDRNQHVHDFDTSSFSMFPSREMGQTQHAMQFNFDISDPRDYEDTADAGLCSATNTPSAPWHFASTGASNIRAVQASGYPAQTNHPTVTYSAGSVLTNKGFHADGIEAYNGEENNATYTDIWDQLLIGDNQFTGVAGSDSHQLVSSGSVANFLDARARTFDELMRSYFEGRMFLAKGTFGSQNRVVLNLDGSDDPYPARHPVFVPSTQASADVQLKITGGLQATDTVTWVVNSTSGGLTRTPVTPGAGSYAGTFTVPISGSLTYVRAEVRDAANAVIAITEPIAFKPVGSMPAGMSFHLEGLSTANGRGYTRDSTKGVVGPSFSTATTTLRIPLTNPAHTRSNLLVTTDTPPDTVTIDGTVLPAALSLDGYRSATDSTWYWDALTHRLYVQDVQAAGTSSVAVAFGASGDDTQPPSVPTGVTATAAGTAQIDVRWTPSTDDVGVTGYTVYRDGVAVGTVTSGLGSPIYSDTGLTPGTTYNYTVDAVDAALNHSAPSAPPVAGRTDAAAGTVVPFAPEADAYVDSANPDKNYGTATTLRADAASPVQVSYLRFNVQNIGSGAPTKALLKIWTNSSLATGFDVFGVADTSWVENAITFNNKPSLATTRTANSGRATAGAYVSVDVTPLVLGNGRVSLALFPTSSTALSMASKEAAANPPVLEVTAGASGPVDTQPPSTPTGLTSTAVDSTTVDLSWGASTDDVGVTHYTVYRNNVEVGTVTTGLAAPTFRDTGLTPSTTYTYTVDAVDGAGRHSGPSTPSSTRTLDPPDTQAPTKPTGLTATPVGANRVDLAWSPSTDDVAVTGYNVYRDGAAVGTVTSGLDAPAYTDPGLTADTQYSYTVEAFDAANNKTASDPATVRTGAAADTEKPAKPTGLTATAGGTDKVALQWTPSTDNVAVTGYNVYRGTQFVGTVTTGLAAPAYTDTGLTAGTTYSYSVEAFDAAQNVSDRSDPATARTDSGADTQKPSKPTGLTAPANGTDRIDLSWTASTDDVGVTGYRVYRDGTPLAPVTTTSFSDTGLGLATAHTYTVEAFDAASNVSDRSDPATATTSGTVTFEPVADSYVTDSPAGTNYGTLATLRTDSSGPLTYSYLRFDVNGLGSKPVTKAVLKVWANSNLPSGFDVYGVADTTWAETGITFTNRPPLAATRTANSGKATTGAYTSSDVTALVTGGGPVSFGLAPTSVTALALASRESTHKPVLEVTVSSASDQQPPATPTGLTATAAGATSVNLSWSPSTDDIAVTGYTVYRDGVAVGTVTSPSFTDTGLTAATTYTYTVDAFDAAGNHSQLSAPKSATTGAPPDTTPPSVPTGLSATSVTSTQVTLGWTKSTDNVGVTGYTVYRDGAAVGTVSGDPASPAFTDTGLTPGTTYTYAVAAFDAAQNASGPSGSIQASTPATSTTITLNPVADSYVTDVPATTNYGSAAYLRVDGAGPVTISYLQFDVAGLSAPPTKAVLRMYSTSSQPVGYDVFGVADNSWTELGINWTNRPALAATKTGASGRLATNTYTSVDITPLVTGNGKMTVAVSTTSSTAASFTSRSAAANKPELVITP
jgi:chitodextrinase